MESAEVGLVYYKWTEDKNIGNHVRFSSSDHWVEVGTFNVAEGKEEKNVQNEKVRSSILSILSGRCLWGSQMRGFKTQESGWQRRQIQVISILWVMAVKAGSGRRGQKRRGERGS